MIETVNKKINPRTIAIIMVLFAGALWGISGTVAQYLFQQQHFSPDWLVVVRLLVSGLLLLVFTSIRNERSIWTIWRSRYDVLSLIIFSLIGMLAVQYTYFAAIQHSNAATATVLQYLAPVLITLFFVIRLKKLPTIIEIFAIGLALLGTFLLVTKGSLTSLSISNTALFWGLASAVTLAFYTLHPIKLLARWGSGVIVGWGMLLGGVAFSFIHPPWHFVGEWSIQAGVSVFFIIIFGTLIAFYCYLESLSSLSASEASLLACIEPLSAAFLAVLWLNVPFGMMEWIGTLCILSTIGLLSLKKQKKLVED